MLTIFRYVITDIKECRYEKNMHKNIYSFQTLYSALWHTSIDMKTIMYELQNKL